VFFYRGWIGPAAVFGGGGGGEMPFYIGGAVNKGHIIEINDLVLSASCRHAEYRASIP